MQTFPPASVVLFELVHGFPCKRFWENFGVMCHADDAKDDGGNVLEYCDQLSRSSLVLLRTPCTQLRLRELCQFILGCADVTPLGVFNNI